MVPSFTIITLPGHPRFSHIHERSIPLMLRRDDYDMWLDPALTNTDPFQELLLQSRIRLPLTITLVDSPSSMKVTGEPEYLAPD